MMATTPYTIAREEEPTPVATVAALPAVLECALPPGVAIRRNAYGHGLFATRAFQSGALLYVTSCLYVSDVAGCIILRIQGTGQEFPLDMEQHSVVQPDKPGLRQLYTFDGACVLACVRTVAPWHGRCLTSDAVGLPSRASLDSFIPHAQHPPLVRTKPNLIRIPPCAPQPL